ncbi:CoA pyrophosphatase [Arcanobacterium phocisimile]|uniref:CoA pyrophosphatase n=1 Tax=Arcanobacterium phocisimile TaxID=1302235 RepID=A0ABX7IGT9_9ACTO|nr:CoA pyrophosphatase [Arcanobacterium phocisimile]QRV02338.1 CoA pyrophosphatase [Arcanobacterium phocisimile]
MKQFNAAVLALLSTEEFPALLVTVRASGMRTHAGQISLPGGGRDSTETPAQTALRETWEEVGIAPEDIEIDGEMPEITAPQTGKKIIPVVGRLASPYSASNPYPLKLSESEVASAHWLKLADLAHPDHRGTWKHSTRVGPGFELDGLMIWGLTGYIVDRLLIREGYVQPWDVTRNLVIPPRFGSR